MDVCKHDCDKQQGDRAVDHFGGLHVADIRSVECEHEDMAADYHRRAAEHLDPIDGLLSGVEPGWRPQLG